MLPAVFLFAGDVGQHGKVKLNVACVVACCVSVCWRCGTAWEG